MIGVLLAAIPLGTAIGAAVLIRAVPPVQRLAYAGRMAVACGLPLTVTAFLPVWPVAFVCWLISGLFAAYLVETTALLVQSMPDDMRAQAFGFLGAWILGLQGAA